MTGGRAGLSLLETLVAIAVAAAVLAALSAALRGTARAQRAADEASWRAQVVALARDLLRSDLAIAGYAGPDGAPPGAEPPLDLRPGPDGPAIVVRYLDDRYRVTPTPIVAVWSASGGTLYRQLSSDRRQPALAGVATLAVASLRDADGRDRAAAPGIHRDVAGLRIELGFVWGDRLDLPVRFLGGPQTVRVIGP